MIQISCHTNIDCAKQLQWPTKLPESPQVGDLIRSTSSTKDKWIELEVHGRTWVKQKDWEINQEVWILRIDLHLPKHRFENISAFEKWVTGRN